MAVSATSSALAIGWCASAFAQLEAPAEASADVDQAVALFEVAERRYQEGRFEEAVALLLEARGLHREAVLSYNLGRAYEELDRLPEAIEAYRQYVIEAPDARDRRAVEARIARLEANAARVESPPPTVEPDDSGGGPSAWPFVLGGVAIAAGGASALFGVLSLESRSDAASDPIHQTSRQSFRDAETFALLSNVSWIAGGALALVSLVWLVVDLASGESSVATRGPSPVAE